MAVRTFRSKRYVPYERWGTGLREVARRAGRFIVGAIKRKVCPVVVKYFYGERFIAVAFLAATILELTLMRIVRYVAGGARFGIRSVQDDCVVERRFRPRVRDVALRACLILVETLVWVVGLVTVDARLVRQCQSERRVPPVGVQVACRTGGHHVGPGERKDRLGVADEVVG